MGHREVVRRNGAPCEDDSDLEEGRHAVRPEDRESPRQTLTTEERMNTCGVSSAANDAARRRPGTMGSAVAVMADRQGAGMPCVPEVPAETLDAPVSNVSLTSDSGRLRKNSVAARPAPRVFASNVSRRTRACAAREALTKNI